MRRWQGIVLALAVGSGFALGWVRPPTPRPLHDVPTVAAPMGGGDQDGGVRAGISPPALATGGADGPESVAVNAPAAAPSAPVSDPPPATGAATGTYTVQAGDTAWNLAQARGLSLAELAAVNPALDLERLRVGAVLHLPRSRGPNAVPALAGALTWPVRGPITSVFGPRWGRHHDGIDIAANTGVAIRAALDGEVETAGWVRGYGNTVILRHGPHLRTLYAHASALLVKTGQSVRQGQPIARVGSTGNSTGPHLHFEVIAGRPRDPLTLLPRQP